MRWFLISLESPRLTIIPHIKAGEYDSPLCTL